MIDAFSPGPGRPLRRGLAICTLTLLAACSSEQNGDQQPPPSPVTLAEVQTETASHRVSYPARVHGATEVAVRARVAGILEARHYEEGTAVEAGQPLFQIEPEDYEDAVASAEAELASAEAEQLRAEREWERVRGLFEREAVSERERDQARADFRAAKARMEAAQSALNRARRQLRYTRVEAPVNGLTSMETVTEGNLVEPGTVLTHIVQHDPVHLHFALPEDDAAGQRLARRAASGQTESEREAELIFGDDSAYARTGRVDFADRRIDPATGSVQMRAVFPNPDGELIPGQFVRVRLTLQRYESAVLINPTAVGQGPEGPRVYTVSDEDRAQATNVRLGPMIDGRRLVLEGLSAGDRLVVNGQVSLSDDAPVKVTNAASEPTENNTGREE